MIRIDMEPALYAEWIRALRSGDYKRGPGYLIQTVFDDKGNDTGERKYCCLGVLFSILGAGDDLRSDDSELLEDNTCGLETPLQNFLAACNDCTGPDPRRTYDEDNNPIVIPDASQVEQGFKTIDPLESFRYKPDLPSFNAVFDRAHTFEPIADYIEANIRPIKET